MQNKNCNVGKRRSENLPKDKIRVVFKDVDKPYEVKEISSDYKTFQQHVKGVFQILPLSMEDNIDIIYNDCYLLNGMRANLILPEQDNILGGPLIFAGYEPNEGDNISLTDEQIEIVKKFIHAHEVYNMSIIEAYFTLQEIQATKSETEAE